MLQSTPTKEKAATSSALIAVSLSLQIKLVLD
jgi:hypothetical protein